MHKTLLVLAMTSLVTCSVVVPVGAQTTILPLGNNAIITAPGQMPSTVQPFGKGAIITTPGQRPVICTPVGTTFLCN